MTGCDLRSCAPPTASRLMEGRLAACCCLLFTFLTPNVLGQGALLGQHYLGRETALLLLTYCHVPAQLEANKIFLTLQILMSLINTIFR